MRSMVLMRCCGVAGVVVGFFAAVRAAGADSGRGAVVWRGGAGGGGYAAHCCKGVGVVWVCGCEDVSRNAACCWVCLSVCLSARCLVG
ncbi:hypothetical protein BDV95DRAFT_204751 [Massariosphaeria phaeospora]|uniref:Secreted protein n=1 Tax=Massariosphaeria phaeospora TaxID=100035 RepID=A0A7C8HZS5_9PLEO|nr:hypothetical protein BDV95DRAFT_204751 [Massariosphaeria phaeospora]